MDLELMLWDDGTVRLAYWDFEHGADRVFVLGNDGKAREASQADNDEEVLIETDLVRELRKMSQQEDATA